MAGAFPRSYFAARYFPPGHFGGRVALVVLQPHGVPGTTVLGASTLRPLVWVLPLDGLASTITPGEATLVPGGVVCLPDSLVPAPELGDTVLWAGTWTVYPDGIANAPALGQPVLAIRYGELQATFFFFF